jgi:tetratricopeptide (TPR) repeat protein
MEFVFITQWASIEAILLFVCLGIFVGIYGYDGYLFIRQFISVFFPKKIAPELIAQSGNEFDTIQDTSLWILWDIPKSQEEWDISQEVIHSNIDKNTVNDLGEISPIFEGMNDIHISTENVENIVSQEEGKTEEKKEIFEPQEEKNIRSNTVWEENSMIIDEIIMPTIPLEETVWESIFEAEEAQEISTEFTTEEVLSENIPIEENNTDIIKHEDLPMNTESVLEELPYSEIHLQDSEEHIEEDVEMKTIIHQEEPIINQGNQFLEEDYKDIQKKDTTNGRGSQYMTQESGTKNTDLTKNSPQVQEKIYQLLGTIKTLVARWQTLEARWLIIQWLALHQEHRDLNIILGSLFEQDRHFDKAELVYKDLAEWYPNDIEILEKLGNVLIIQRRYTIAFEIYKKILIIGGETEAALYIITHLASELGFDQEKYDLAKRYLKRWPNNPEVISLLAQSEILLGLRQDAIQTLIKLKNLTPYNWEIMETIQKLIMEEEMAGNFWG